MSNQADSKLWSTRIMYGVCLCTDGTHSSDRIYNTFEQIRDAEQERQDNEHIVRVKQSIYLKVLAQEVVQ